MQRALIALWIGSVTASTVHADDTSLVLDDGFHHLRIDGPPEWAGFPEKPEAALLDLRFESNKNDREWTLRLRQQDVKQNWDVLLNDKSLGRLVRDENDMVVYFKVPAGAVAAGENRLQVRQQTARRSAPDDIRAGRIELVQWPLTDVLNEATLEIEVTDGKTDRPLPARITITDANGSLQTTGAEPNDHLAVRPGTVYTSTGNARIGLPAGKYTIHVGRGFEYSLASTTVELSAGARVKKSLTIRREVPTEGYVACDTHVHTLTHSGHGDASVEERMITLAAEGIELPIATDHNVHIDHRPFARALNVSQYFTPVIGNEVTTKVGHFNTFPVLAGAKIPDFKLDDWQAILNDIYRTPGVEIAILNHARDVHSGVRPFGPERFNGVVGENLDGWAMRFNAMEVVNSGATQTEPLQLFHDWMALLNRGYDVTPVGSSDSHDVARHFVGQGRTYIRGDDRDAGRIDVKQAVDNFRRGRVMVSYGLLAEIEVDGMYASGELARVSNEEVQVGVRVLGPHWVQATRVDLYANGQPIRTEKIPADALRDLPAGVKWQGRWTLPRPKHDVHLVAIATGPGIDGSYWKTAKPYQPTSPHWEPRVIGCSGAVWLDTDGDGRKTAAYDYARRAFAESRGDLPKLIETLADYDWAVAAQAAHLYQSSGESLTTPAARKLIGDAGEHVKAGFGDYLEAWRENEIARSSQ